MDSTDSWENILSELDLTDHRQDLAAAGYDSFKALMNMPEADMDRFSFPLDSLIETQKVFQFLKGARLEKFAEKFIELGFSTMEDLKHMSDSDLLKCGVGQPGHQNRFASQKQQHFRPDHVEPLPVPSASMEGPSARQCHEVKVQEADEQAAASCDFHSMPSAEEVCPVQAAALPFSPPLRGSTGVFDQELDSLASSPLADDLDKLHLLAEHSPRKCDFKRKGLDLDCLAGVIEDSTDAVNATAGKNVILLMGSTGSGKTCFMHTLAGRELVRQSRDVNGQNQEVWEAKDPLEGFTIGHNKARSETRSLRALWLPEAKAVVVDAPGQLDTRASEIDIATSAVCHRIAEGCRMLRFVVLINCYTLQADRAGGLRRVAELVANVLPDLGKRREHPLAINFFFTHVEALNIQELTPETARGEVHHWLREVLDGSDETESLAALRWMRKSMDLYEKGTLRYRLVDVYNPEWATLREVRKAVIRFKAEYALGQEGGLIQANSVGAILMPASKVKIEYMLQASRDEARKVLEEATPEDVPMLRNLWKNVELVRDYLISLPSARIVRDEISNIFTRRFEVLWQDATALLRKLESDSEDFSELEADKLWNTICVMEGIASLGQGSGDCCFQNRLECSLDTCLARLKQVSVATDLATLPRTHEIIRWQSKINAWNAIKPDWAKQMSLLIEAHCEQAASEAKKVHELGNRVIVVARQENVKDIASEVDALDGWNMEEIFHESFDALQTQFQQVFENASELALSSVKAVLESPASTPKFDFTMLGEVATSIEESRSAWDGAEGVAPQTRARLATWHQHLRGAVTGWLSDLLEGSRVVLQTVAQLAAGNDDQDVHHASGTCYKNIFDTMRNLAESLPEAIKQICVKDFCEVARMEVLSCVKQLTTAASTLSTQTASGSVTSMALESLILRLAVLEGFLWIDSVNDNKEASNSFTEVLDTIKQQIKKYSDDLCRRFETSFCSFLEGPPSSRTTSEMTQAWESFQRLSTLTHGRQLVDADYLKGKMETLLEKWLCGFRAMMAKPEVEPPEPLPADQIRFCAIKAPEVELERLDEWPAEDLNNILHAHDQLQPLFPDALPCGWKQALERLQKATERTKMFFFSCMDESGNYKEKDLILCALQKWRELGLQSLLEKLCQESLERQVKQQVLKELDNVHEMIMDPMQRQTAASKLGGLNLTDLQSAAFNEAKRSLQEYRCLLNARNVEDDKAIQCALESFNFKGLKELLGEAPGTASAETAATKLFHQRLDAIKHVVLDRLTLAGRSLLEPEKFATEFRSLKAAEREIGEYLKLYQETNLTEEVQKIGQQATDHVQTVLEKIKAEIERKSYDSCLDHADELQALVDQWRSLEVFTTTQLSETDRAILKARGCLETVKPLVTSFLEMARQVDEKTNSKSLVYELRQLQAGHRSDIKDAYRTAVEHVNQDLDAFVQDISQIAQSCSSYSIDALELLRKHFDEGLRDHLFNVPARVQQELEQLKREVESRNEDLLAKLYSEEKIEQLKAELDALKSMSQSPLHGIFEGAYCYFITTAEEQMQANLRAQSALKDYNNLKDAVNHRITENVQDGLDGVSRGNFEVAGSVLRFKHLIEGRLRDHLRPHARTEMNRFEKEVQKLLLNKLLSLLRALSDGQDVRRAIVDLGHLL